jgi:nitrite reductase/ring-hydroxylating ferredoxin subunit
VGNAGLLMGTILMRQCHGSKFDVTSGAVLQGPATETLHTYDVQEQEGKIQVKI